MDNEGDNSSFYPQKDKLDGGVLGKKSIKKTSHPIGNSSATQQRRASLASSFNGDSSRRDSSGKFSSPNNKEDVIPHYLRASTGSCHDLCKYGKRHTVEQKPWHSFSNRIAKTPSSKLRSKESVNSVETNKATEVKHIPRKTKTQTEDLNPSSDKTISQNSSEMMNNEFSSSPKEEVELSPDKLETDKDVLNPLPDKTISQNSSEIIKDEVSKPPLEIEPSPDKLETAKDVLNPSPGKTISQSSSEIIENEVSLSPKEVELSPDKLETVKDVLETELKTSNMPMGHVPLLQPKAVLVKASPSHETSEGNLRKGRINRKIKDGKVPQVSNISRSSDASQGQLRSRKHSEMDRKTLAESKLSQKDVLGSLDNLPSSMVSTNKNRNLTSRKNNNSKLVPLKDQTIIRNAANGKQLKNEKVTVKTLNGLEKDTVRTLSKPIRRRGVAASSHKQDQIEEEGEGERDEDETEGIDDAATKLITTNKDTSKGKRKEGAEVKITRTLRKGTTMKNKDSSPMKLNFRRGKVVQIHSDNNTPRILKFRRGLTLMGNKDAITDVKKIYKKGVVDDKDVADPSSKKVVLRHQDVQNKKIDPGLLNNVIEETASKLVGSRKSKVKALVGAFETVISLQESKPPTNAAS